MAIAIEQPAADTGHRLERLYDLHQQRLYRFALRIARNEDEARDLIQDAFVRAAQNLSRIPEDDHAAMSWLVRVVVNLSRDRHRRHVVRDAFRRLVRSEAHDPRAALDAAAAVRAALASLPPRQRAIIVLHHFDGEPCAAIAAMLGVAEVTVRWHLSTARKRMAAFLEGIPS